MWISTLEIKILLGIVTTDYDVQIELFNPIAQARVESYIHPNVIDSLPSGFTPSYARLVYLMLSEGSVDVSSGNVKAQSFDGESISYGDVKSTDIAKTSDEQLRKFKPLKKRYL